MTAERPHRLPLFLVFQDSGFAMKWAIASRPGGQALARRKLDARLAKIPDNRTRSGRKKYSFAHTTLILSPSRTAVLRRKPPFYRLGRVLLHGQKLLEPMPAIKTAVYKHPISMAYGIVAHSDSGRL
jgi:hypothetical protein